MKNLVIISLLSVLSFNAFADDICIPDDWPGFIKIETKKIKGKYWCIRTSKPFFSYDGNDRPIVEKLTPFDQCLKSRHAIDCHPDTKNLPEDVKVKLRKAYDDKMSYELWKDLSKQREERREQRRKLKNKLNELIAE